MSWYSYRPYVSAGQRRANAAKHAQKLAKKGQVLAPVKIEGRAIAHTFWGKAWCAHLESFGDYLNRLPRGRTYVRNGSVIDLQITPGKITAMIMGSELYRGTISIVPLAPQRWQAIKAKCAGKIDSLVALLQGRLSDPVMRVITDRDQGHFPSPAEIKLTCSCPDSAVLCKHLAAVLYGVGARLDAQPELLFVLRGVDHLELISAAADAPGLAAGANAATVEGGLDAAALGDVFGIEIDAGEAAAQTATVPVGAKASSAAKKKKVQPGHSAPKKRAAKPKAPAGPRGAKRSNRRGARARLSAD